MTSLLITYRFWLLPTSGIIIIFLASSKLLQCRCCFEGFPRRIETAIIIGRKKKGSRKWYCVIQDWAMLDTRVGNALNGEMERSWQTRVVKFIDHRDHGGRLNGHRWPRVRADGKTPGTTFQICRPFYLSSWICTLYLLHQLGLLSSQYALLHFRIRYLTSVDFAALRFPPFSPSLHGHRQDLELDLPRTLRRTSHRLHGTSVATPFIVNMNPAMRSLVISKDRIAACPAHKLTPQLDRYLPHSQNDMIYLITGFKHTSRPFRTRCSKKQKIYSLWAKNHSSCIAFGQWFCEYESCFLF